MDVVQGDHERSQIEARCGMDATTVGVLKDLGLVSDRLLAASELVDRAGEGQL